MQSNKVFKIIKSDTFLLAAFQGLSAEDFVTHGSLFESDRFRG